DPEASATRKWPHRLIQLRLQALAAPVDVRRICCRRGGSRSAGILAGHCASAEIQESIFELDRPIVPECPSTPAPTVQPTRVSEAAKLNGVTTVGFVKTHLGGSGTSCTKPQAVVETWPLN